MSLIDILSGQSSSDYRHQQGQAGKRADLVNRTLFETMTEDRQERRVRKAAGSAGQFQLPEGQEGPQIAGTGYFSDNPDERILAQILMSNINPSAFQPMLTQATKVTTPEAPPTIKIGTIQKGRRNTPQGPEEVSMRYIGGPVEDVRNSWQEVTTGSYVAPYQREGAKLREKADFEYYQGLHGKADKLSNTARDYEYINQILQGVDTGMFDEAILVSQKFAKRLGAESFDDSIAAREAALSAYNQAVLTLMKPDSDTGKRALAGQSSNKELDFFKEIPNGLGKTASGRELIALVARMRAQRADEIAVMSFDAEEKGVPANQFRKLVRDRFKNIEVSPRWKELLGQAKEELKTSDKFPSTLKVGTIEDGYKFVGGDPGEPESWKKVK
jgi:hypothetical protein